MLWSPHTSKMARKGKTPALQVKHIQEEYQKYMEKVRGKAQGSIDQANLLFQARRHDLTGHVDNIVAFMQQRFLSVQVCNPGPEILLFCQPCPDFWLAYHTAQSCLRYRSQLVGMQWVTNVPLSAAAGRPARGSQSA